jgi:DNA-binding beta-propeller fold protein YncE
MNRTTRAFFLAFIFLGSLSEFCLRPASLFAAAIDLYVGSYTFNPTAPNFRVRRIDGLTGDPYDGLDGTFAGSDGLSFPRGLAFGPDGNLYVASEGTNNILKYHGTTGAFLSEFIPAGAGSEPFEEGLGAPKGIAFGPDGNLYVASNGSPNALFKFNGTTGAFIADLAETIPGPGTVSLAPPIWGLTFGPDGQLYVSSGASGNVTRFNPLTETYTDEFVSLGSGGLSNPHGLTFGPDGNLYVAGGDVDGRVWKYNGTTGASLGLFVTLADNGGLKRPDGIAFGPDGNLYVSSTDTGRVLRYSGSTGSFFDVFAELDFPANLSPTGLVFHPAVVVPEPGAFVFLTIGCVIAVFVARRGRA